MSKYLTCPYPPIIRNLLGLDFVIFFTAEVPEAFQMFLSSNAERYIMHPWLQPLFVPFPKECKGYFDTIYDLIDRDLIERHQSAEGPFLSINPTVQIYLIYHMTGIDGDRAALIRAVRGAFTIIRGAMPVSPSDLNIQRQDWKAYDTCVPHILRFSDTLGLSGLTYFSLSDISDDIAELLLDAGKYLRKRGSSQCCDQLVAEVNFFAGLPRNLLLKN
jgi:hypothetical protein